MTSPDKASEPHPHTIKWDGQDWERLERAARVLSEREHLDLAPVDIIRSGARRFVEEVLNGELAPTAKAS